MQIRGLLPGQQVIKLPDGKLQIVTPQQQTASSSTVSQLITPPPPLPAPAVSNAGTPMKLAATTTAAAAPAGSQSTLQQLGQSPKIVYPGQTAAAASSTPTTQPTVIATPLAPGSQIPNGMEVSC